MYSRLIALSSGLTFLLLGGCSFGQQVTRSAEYPNKSIANTSIHRAVPQSHTGLVRAAMDGQDLAGSDDHERLALLWQNRKNNSLLSDYPLGPGDILEINVPDLKEIQKEQVRISGEGTTELPLVGTIQAAGLTEKELKKEIRRLLQVDYMRDPQVSLFVVAHHNRQVAVLGAVEQPGLYDLQSEANTILDMVSLAGGMTDKAAPRLLFIPAELVKNRDSQQLVSALPVQLESAASSPTLLKKTDPITIDLRNLTRGGNQLYLALPARPGDVIMVPGSGDILVDGWVARPGAYKISPGMTVVGAVTAAGGSLFAADTSTVKLIRTHKTGERTFHQIDIDKVAKGELEDIAIQEGDLIQVSSSQMKLVPYGFFQLMTGLFRVGMSVPTQ